MENLTEAGQINAIKNSQQAQCKIIFVKLPGKHSIQALADIKIYLALGFHAIDTNKQHLALIFTLHSSFLLFMLLLLIFC